MPLVYRIEHPSDGKGPYTTNYPYDDEDMKWDHKPANNHPNPWADSMSIEIKKDQYCGFTSLDFLYAWFKGYLTNLHNNGFIIKVYDNKEPFTELNSSTATGQVVFYKNDCELVETKPIKIID